MAEVTSGNVVVLVLSQTESAALGELLDQFKEPEDVPDGLLELWEAYA